jgi:TonB-linked SusC/RagA family outer membrane protein
MPFDIEAKALLSDDRWMPHDSEYVDILCRSLRNEDRRGILVNGVIKSVDGTRLPGVNILVKGTSSGVTSDINGQYQIEVYSTSDILMFSFIGYKTYEVEVASRTEINVVLEEDVKSLQEVEVRSVGYWTVSKNEFTGNIAKVNKEDIERQPLTSPLMSIQGRMAGVNVTPINGAPGSAPRIEIRGQNSLRSDGGYPLYVIDGVPMDPTPLKSKAFDFYSGGFDPLSMISPGNIEKIEILKDAAATSIYGSRGANGVIIITTKGGEKASRTGVNLEVYSGFGRLPRKVELLNAQDYLKMRHEAFRNDGAIPSIVDFDLNGAWDTLRTTDWQKEILDNASSVNSAQIELSGGSARTSVRLRGELYKETSLLSNSFGFDRQNISINTNHMSNDAKFKFSSSINYGRTQTKMFNSAGFIQNVLYLPPVAPGLRDTDGSLNWEIVELFPGFKTNSWVNPLSSFLRSHDSNYRNLVSNVTFGYSIVPGLDIRLNVGYTETSGDEITKNPIGANSPTIAVYLKGSANFSFNDRSTWIAEPQISYTYSRKWGTLDLIAGATYQGSEQSYLAISGTGYTSDLVLGSILGAPVQNVISDDKFYYKYAAAFARIAYKYSDKYFLDFTGRRDGSSRFGRDRQFGNFGAVGVAWIFSNENILRDQDIFSFGKIRASYGITGNDQIGDYMFLDTYKLGQGTYQNTVALLPSGLFNPGLGWEETTKLETGLELRFFNDRFGVDLSRYENLSSNQLVTYPLPDITGFSGVSRNLGATISNIGYEGVIQATVINANVIKWSVSANVTLPRNKLVSYPGIENSSYSDLYKIGESTSIQRRYLSTGVNTETGLYGVSDYNNDGAIDFRDKVFTRPTDRKVYGGISNNFTFNRFDFSFLFQFADFVQSDSRFFGAMPGLMFNQPKGVMTRWTSPGDFSGVGRFSQDYSNADFYNNYLLTSDVNVERIRFLRLKTLSLSYRFSPGLLERLKLENANIYIQCQNLFVVGSKYNGFDPETQFGLPPLRTITAGIKIGF